MINNAGVTRTSDIMGLNEDDWYWINNINSKGTFLSPSCSKTNETSKKWR